ncbi:multicopper oxidase domain-containing protein [Mariprofundus sp. KV]|uniref:multicopper oxidase domain-containing protein n=1 Tax=Mariprofundus sp. KV TaxID=2608715 RepID=UPI0015A27EC2|nr:multicopper oxidase domain-containing protein [Mariprofundus sp. KV]NWF35428.1 multicopper oxidase domain-containing protein [Mariprofundus sp. KV]
MNRMNPLLMSVVVAVWAATAMAAEYELTVDEKMVSFSGEQARALAVNGTIPAPTLYFKEGEEVVIRVRNRLSEPSSIHWHGLIIPSDMDGVPGLSFDGIPPGKSFTYRFTPQQSGTYWYHSHSGFQEQQGVYGAIIIEPADQSGSAVDRDYIVMLSDWTDENPNDVLKHLKSESDYYKKPRRDLVSFFSKLAAADAGQRQQMWRERRGFARMRMDPSDISDVTGYTFLMNGQSSRDSWQAAVQPGERVRLRFINAAAASYFDVSIPGLVMSVVAADGQQVEPVSVDSFNIAIAETYDVIVELAPDSGPKAFTIFAQAMDRSGYVHGTLSTQTGLKAGIPAMDRRKVLKMDDVMPDHAGHGSANGNHAMDHHADHDHHAKPVKLSYSDLKSLEKTDGDVTRELTIRLTGNMERYFWSFDDVKYAMAEPVEFEFGERVRVHLVNETMMHHPIHLHGLWQVLQNGQGPYAPKLHTIDVPPKQTVTVDVPVDNRGRWAFHCHILYHMATGMMREVRVK